MQQISVPFAEKLDVPLMELCNSPELAPSAPVPVVVRYSGEGLPGIVDRVRSLGGRPRHEMPLLHALAIWLPLVAVADLARLESVQRLELDQEFAIA